VGTLYLVATPLGNLEDITLRALRILAEVRLIAAEDTRRTRHLLDHYRIATPCRSYHEHNKLARLAELLEVLAEGDLALVSDAGTPLLADPGAELVHACIAAGHTVSPIPGPSAVVAALVAADLPADRFLYLGFLPRHGPARRALLADLADLTFTLVCYEAPHRLIDTLSEMQEIFGDRSVTIANDVTKRFEAFVRGRFSEVIPRVSAQRPRGEFTLVVAGAAAGERKRDRHAVRTSANPNEPPSEAQLIRRLRQLRDEGLSGSAAARAVSREFGLQKSVVYQIWLSMGADQGAGGAGQAGEAPDTET
jgi:16S rRNA (cytidine1402-2'-O)-methyltransferase